MNLALNVITNKKAIRPSKDNLILYDGKNWYITTKQDVFKEMVDYVNKANEELEKLKQETAQFKLDTAEQILKLTNLVNQLYSNK